MKHRLPRAARGLALAAILALAPASHAASPLLEPVRTRMAAAEASARASRTALERAPLLLAAGRPEEAARLLPDLLAEGLPGKLLAARVLFAVADYARLRPLVEDLAESAPQSAEARALLYRWWILVDDLAAADRAILERTRTGDLTHADRIAAGRLAGLLLDHAGSSAHYAEALEKARTAADSAAAYQGLGKAAYELRDFDASLAHLERALPRSAPDADLLELLAETLIRLGRTDEAIEACELAVAVDPFHERAHYMLGNGYARKSYTQLFAAYPEAFADAAGLQAMRQADALLAAGKPDMARRDHEELRAAHPGWADVLVRLGSLDFAEGRLADARARFTGALAVCPEYGRAHNGLAKSLEAERLGIEVHRPAYEARFAARPMPEVAGIDSFVTNWRALSPRHRKQVAISIAPWKAYLPVLIASGSTYYIKPLHELLSETPGQELLRDQRIHYDSRLWDDVRGCGGYNTVTGVEDVERTVLNRYNTVLHELTHQVHGVLTAAQKRSIQELYRRTKEREEAGGDAFLSRYAAGSVWEYFAEGANALESPRRDAYDTRDILRERLDARDPALRVLVESLMAPADVESCFAVGFTNRGDDELTRGHAGQAIASYRLALDRLPGEETATASLIYARQVGGETAEALDAAEAAALANPASAALALRHASALWHGGKGLDAAIAALEAARPAVRAEERYLIDLERGRLFWILGDGARSQLAYEAVLGYQADSPEGLWGLAAALALEGRWEEAWLRYEEAMRLRTGVVDLRADFARDLLRAGEIVRAREQVDAALLLDPEDPTALALLAWAQLEQGDPAASGVSAARALELGPWCDLARIIWARAQTSAGAPRLAEEILAPLRERLDAGAPPEYVYRPKWGRYDEVHGLPEVERALLAGGK